MSRPCPPAARPRENYFRAGLHVLIVGVLWAVLWENKICGTQGPSQSQSLDEQEWFPLDFRET